MNILVVNASPKGEMSNTLHITHAFLDGLEVYGPHDVTVFMVRDKKIEFCRGCFSCMRNGGTYGIPTSIKVLVEFSTIFISGVVSDEIIISLFGGNVEKFKLFFSPRKLSYISYIL